MKKAIVVITSEILRELLQLPDGAILESIDAPIYENGALRIRLAGVGWDVAEGSLIRIAQRAEIKVDDSGTTIDWKLEE